MSLKLKNCIYRFINQANEIIYIGKAKDLKQRLAGHRHLPEACYAERVRIEFTMFLTEDDMDLAERYYIPKHKPKYNVIWNQRFISLDLSRLDNVRWLVFGEDEFIREQLSASYEQISLEGEQKQLMLMEPLTKVERMTNQIKELTEEKTLIEVKLKTIQLALNNALDCFYRSDEMKIFTQKGYVFFRSYEGLLLAFVDSLASPIPQRKVAQASGEEAKACLNLFMEQERLEARLIELELELPALRKKRLKLALKDEYAQLPKELKDALLQSDCLSLDELVQKKLMDLSNQLWETTVSSLEEKGMIDKNEWLISIHSLFRYHPHKKETAWMKWLDPQIKSNQSFTPRTREFALAVIEQLIDRLQLTYPTLTEEIIFQEKKDLRTGEWLPEPVVVFKMK